MWFGTKLRSVYPCCAKLTRYSYATAFHSSWVFSSSDRSEEITKSRSNWSDLYQVAPITLAPVSLTLCLCHFFMGKKIASTQYQIIP
jgi:hypothetical protein